MPSPKTPWGTCRHCGGRIAWQSQVLSEQQKAENAALRAEGKSAKHHAYHGSRWTHAPEKPGEDKRHCPESAQPPLKPGQKWRMLYSAEPKEWCNEHTQGDNWHSGGLCNRLVKGEHNGTPMCGTHLHHATKYEKQRSAEQEANDLQNWHAAEVQKVVDILKSDYGLDSHVHKTRQCYPKITTTVTGKIVVDPKELLELLEETF